MQKLIFLLSSALKAVHKTKCQTKTFKGSNTLSAVYINEIFYRRHRGKLSATVLSLFITQLTSFKHKQYS